MRAFIFGGDAAALISESLCVTSDRFETDRSCPVRIEVRCPGKCGRLLLGCGLRGEPKPRAGAECDMVDHLSWKVGRRVMQPCSGAALCSSFGAKHTEVRKIC